jgi:hypothetical protein
VAERRVLSPLVFAPGLVSLPRRVRRLSYPWEGMEAPAYDPVRPGPLTRGGHEGNLRSWSCREGSLVPCRTAKRIDLTPVAHDL